MRILRVAYRHLFCGFLKTVAAVTIIVAIVAFLIDFIDFARMYASSPHYVFVKGMLLSALKLPSIIETVTPFLAQISAVALLSVASRRNELVIMRSIGLSAFHFVAPLCVVSFLLGVVSTTLFNPLAVATLAKSRDVEAELRGSAPRNSDDDAPLWFSFPTSDGFAVIGARGRSGDRFTLYGGSYLRFDKAGALVESVTSKKLVWKNQTWSFDDYARMNVVTGELDSGDDFVVGANLTEAALLERASAPDDTPFFALPRAMRVARAGGQPVNPYLTRFYLCLFLPFFLVGMTLLATPIASQFERSGKTTGLIVSTLVAGFSVFLISGFMKALGGSGVMSPLVAAAVAPVLTIGFGVTWLLTREDG